MESARQHGFCQFSCCDSVRDISNGLKSATGNLNHLGISRAPYKSTVAYQNSNRNSVFRYILHMLHLTKTDLKKWLNELSTPPPYITVIA
ncbi:MAG: DUF4372 domain-containing protein [Paludibacteraceae bacterium]|nr:DUF4372 domain-containing protein [Paludibacteraceae bacterium]